VKNKLARIALIILAIILGSSYELWRGYQEQRSIGVSILYAVFGWVIFFAFLGVFSFRKYLFGCRDEKLDSSRH